MLRAWITRQPKEPIGVDEIGFYVEDAVTAWCRRDELPNPLPKVWREPFPVDLSKAKEPQIARFTLGQRLWIHEKRAIYEPAYRFEGWE